MLRKIDAPDVLKCRAIDVVLEMKKRSRRTIFSFSSPYTRICLILGLRGSIESTEGIDVETEQACLFQPSQDALTTLCEYICLFPDVAFEWLEVFRFQELDPTVLLRCFFQFQFFLSNFSVFRLTREQFDEYFPALLIFFLSEYLSRSRSRSVCLGFVMAKN